MISAKRRHNKDRKINRALEVAKRLFFRGREETTDEYMARCTEWAKRHADNLKPCSCAMCCNTRRSPYYKGRHKGTMQERRAKRVNDHNGDIEETAAYAARNEVDGEDESLPRTKEVQTLAISLPRGQDSVLK